MESLARRTLAQLPSPPASSVSMVSVKMACEREDRALCAVAAVRREDRPFSNTACASAALVTT
eukprot:4640268-Pyramimonas_sp.AAC.2